MTNPTSQKIIIPATSWHNFGESFNLHLQQESAADDKLDVLRKGKRAANK